MKLDEVAGADDVLEAARFVLGAHFAPPTGVVQTCATLRDGDVIRIGEHAPKSAWDFFLLNLARASADVIVTTGKILRDEPALRYDLEGPPGVIGALHAYRDFRANKPARADVVVLSSGRDLDLSHPTFRGWARPVLALPDDATRARRDAEAAGIEVRTFATLSLRSLVGALTSEGRTVSIEAGPTSARALYDVPVAVSSLWLSRFEGDVVSEARGEPFIADDVLEARLGNALSDVRIVEPSGTWRFRRYTRAA